MSIFKYKIIILLFFGGTFAENIIPESWGTIKPLTKVKMERLANIQSTAATLAASKPLNYATALLAGALYAYVQNEEEQSSNLDLTLTQLQAGNYY